jgi:hypothetical protein
LVYLGTEEVPDFITVVGKELDRFTYRLFIYKEHSLSGCNAVLFGESFVFWRNMFPPSSGSKSKPSKKSAEGYRKQIPPNCMLLNPQRQKNLNAPYLFLVYLITLSIAQTV